jgi:hypothetical protein
MLRLRRQAARRSGVQTPGYRKANPAKAMLGCDEKQYSPFSAEPPYLPNRTITDNYSTKVLNLQG